MFLRFAEVCSEVRTDLKFNHMKKNWWIGVATCLAASLFASCVNEEYQLSEDRINLEVTVFQDGLSVPLGSTAKIMLKDVKDSLLNNFEDYQKYFAVGPDGEYSISISDHMDLSDNMNDILAQIKVPDVAVSEKFSFNLNSVDVSDLKVPASDYSYAEQIGDMISAPDFSFKGLGAELEINSGLYEYSLSDEVLQLNLPKISYEEVINMPQEVISFNHKVILPEEIESIDHISLSENSQMSISIMPENMIPGLNVELESLRITLPDGIEVEGAQDGVLSYSGINVSEDGYARNLRILGIGLPQPKDGEVELDMELVADAVVKVSGKVSISDFPVDEENDLRFKVAVKADVEIADYSVTVTGYEYSVDYNQEFKFDVTGMEEFGTVTVLPAGNPEIVVDVEMPETGVVLVADPKENLVISFPKMLQFKDLPKEYNYDKDAGTVTLKGEIPSQIRLPLDRLVVTPVKENGKYWAKGEFKVAGGVSIAAGTVTKADVDVLTAPGSAIGLTARIPEIMMETIAMDKPYEKVIEKQFAVSLLSSDVLPSELVSVETVEFEDVYFTMTLDASQLPDLGPTRMSLDFELGLPSIMVLDSDNVKEGNVLSVKGELDKDGMIILEPVRVAGLNMTGIDLKDPEALKDTVSINGKVILDNIALDINQWLGKTLNVSVDAGVKDIVISKLFGQVDVGLPPMDSSIDFTGVKDLLNNDNMEITGLENLLSRVNLMVDVKSNIGIPMMAKMVLTPYFGGEPDESAVWSADASMNYTTSAADTTHTRYWLSSLEKENDPYLPEGFEHMYFPLKDYVKSMPDSLKVRLEIESDTEKISIIEPNHTYLIAADYSVDVPMEFGDGASVVYRDTIPDLPEFVGQLLAMGDLVLTGKVTTLLPFAISVKVNLLDSDGNRVPLDEASSVQKIVGCTPDGKPAVTDLYLGVKKAEGAVVKDVDAVELEFNLATVAGVPLSDDCFIQATVQALVPDGVGVDVNELMNGGLEL